MALKRAFFVNHIDLHSVAVAAEDSSYTILKLSHTAVSLMFL